MVIKDIEWNNGDIAFAEGCSHDEIKFIGLSGNKAVAICECITDDRRVILDKLWVSDLLKERPLSKEEIEKQKDDAEIKELTDFLLNNGKDVLKNCHYECGIVAKALHDAGYRKGEFLDKEDIEKKSRLESAYDLYDFTMTGLCMKVCSYEEFIERNEDNLNYWLSIVDKTGYRKGEL